MSAGMWVRSHVELLVRREAELNEIDFSIDDDGNWWWRAGSADCGIHVLDFDVNPLIHLAARAVTGVKKSGALLTELNDFESSRWAKVQWTRGEVVASILLSAVGLTHEVLADAMRSIEKAATELGPMIATVYGGTTPYPPGGNAIERVDS